MGVVRSTYTATYTVNADCTGSWETDAGATADIVLVDGGKEIRYLATQPDRVATGIFKRQDLSECTSATLEGRYGLILNGTIFTQGLLAAVGVLTFDGKETESYSATLMVEGTGLTYPNLTGTYMVNPDCTGSADLGGTGVTLDFVIVHGGDEILQIATRPDRVVTWNAKRQ